MRLQPPPRRSARALLLLATSAMTLLLLLCIVPSGCQAIISDQRLCYDEACSVPVSQGRTTLPYNSNSRDVLSFPANTVVTVYSKEAGSRKDLWGVEIRGRRGYAPSTFIREYKIYHKKDDLKYTVPTEDTSREKVLNVTQEPKATTQSSDPTVSGNVQTDQVQAKLQEDAISKEAQAEKFDPHQVSPSYESIYDGTVIPLENENGKPTIQSYSTKILADEESIAAKLGKDEELMSLNSSSDNLSEEEVVAPPAGETVTLPSTDDSIDLLNESAESQGNKDVESSYSSEIPVEDTGSKEEVQLDMYPSILSSTFSALSGMLGNGEESSEDSIEVDSSEKSVDEETTEETPVINKPEESSPEINLDQITDKIGIEDELKKVENEFVEEAENKKLDETPQSETDQIFMNEKIPDDLDAQIDKIINEINELSSTQDENLDQNHLHKDKGIVDPNSQNETINNSHDALKSANAEPVEATTNPDESLTPITENGGSYSEVSKPKGIETSSSSENLEVQSSIDTDQLSLQDPKANSTVIDTIVGDNPATLEVSLKEQDNEESAPVLSETLLSKAKNFAPTDSVPIESVENNHDSSLTLEERDILESTTIYSETFLSEKKEPTSTDDAPTNDTRNNHDSSFPKVETISTPDGQTETGKDTQINNDMLDSNNNIIDTSTLDNTKSPLQNDSTSEHVVSDSHLEKTIQEQVLDVPDTLSIGEFLNNRNLLNAEEGKTETDEIASENTIGFSTNAITMNQIKDEVIEVANPVVSENSIENVQISQSHDVLQKVDGNEVKDASNDAKKDENPFVHHIEEIVTDVPLDTRDQKSHCSNEFAGHQYRADVNAVTNERRMEGNSETLLVVCITAVTTLLFSLGYYFIESKRRDAYLVGKINVLEKELMITKKECTMLDENFKSTKTKLDSIEDESFGSNEMVLSLKAELVAAENTKVELEDQIATLEKELESTSEAGLELERMLREILSTHSDENNPLAKSIEDLQVRLNDQQMANESLTNALAAKSQELDFCKLENETLTGDLSMSLKKVEQLEIEITKLAEEVKSQMDAKHNLEQTLTSKVHKLEVQVKSLSEDKAHIRKQLKMKELEVKELSEVVEKFNSDSLNFEKLYEVSHIKAEAVHTADERDELKMKLSEEEGARQLLEEHMKVINQEVASLSEQCKAAEKEKKDAETRLEVLTKFFEEKESQRQKEEALWLEKQGEVSTTVDRLHTMQAEILNYKQQIEMLKREIFDQEREYKNQISALENKAHEHWLAARQNERRLEEVKAECSQLRNRLTLVEKSINDVDSDAKLNRLHGANGETSAHTSSLYPGGETSTSPLLFSPGGGGGSGGVPPPSYLFGMPPPPPPPTLGYLPLPPELVGSRPPPLGGGRLSSPPPPPQSSSSATHSGANNASSSAASPPPLMPPFPMPPFPGDHLPPLPPLHMLKHLPPPSAGGPLPPLSFPPQHPAHHLHHNHHGAPWPPDDPADGAPPSSFARTGSQQQRHNRNHKGSLHSSGESLDKSHHSGKV
ncbi:hypothetical protein QAD02_003966 [Eretmocerus hayati]|uniref:Uncharacterized protein n=1 Tax=Eretmocerus hayati TaxID=131215 RepID=A0ACC2NP80_9HYME|nr:hypothetical protein QAD02_003966 [Eretmocerus hayati]